MSDTKAIVVLFVLLVLVSSFFTLESLASDEEDAAVSAISGAEDSVGLAYEYVLDAEVAGANVSNLLVRLNVAVDYLAEAYMALTKGDSAGAIDDADRSRELAHEVKADAVELKERVPQERFLHLLSSVMQSMIAMCVIGVGSIISWHVFKSRFQPRIPETYPEVNRDGAERVS